MVVTDAPSSTTAEVDQIGFKTVQDVHLFPLSSFESCRTKRRAEQRYFFYYGETEIFSVGVINKQQQTTTNNNKQQQTTTNNDR